MVGRMSARHIPIENLGHTGQLSAAAQNTPLKSIFAQRIHILGAYAVAYISSPLFLVIGWRANASSALTRQAVAMWVCCMKWRKACSNVSERPKYWQGLGTTCLNPSFGLVLQCIIGKQSMETTISVWNYLRIHRYRWTNFQVLSMMTKPFYQDSNPSFCPSNSSTFMFSTCIYKRTFRATKLTALVILSAIASVMVTLWLPVTVAAITNTLSLSHSVTYQKRQAWTEAPVIVCMNRTIVWKIN